MKLKILKGAYQVAKLAPNSAAPENALCGEFFSVTRTEEELSVVCAQDMDFACESREPDWRILKIEGPLDFSLIGILSKISTILADDKISIFAVSTYNTDYILVKSKDLDNAVLALEKSGYEIA